MKHGIPLKLGWSNPNCGPESMRLYALDLGDQPRWAEPHARCAETVLRERGAHEGSRWRLVPDLPEAGLDRAVEQFQRVTDKFQLHPSGAWVEGPLEDIVAALLAAGWRPPEVTGQERFDREYARKVTQYRAAFNEAIEKMTSDALEWKDSEP